MLAVLATDIRIQQTHFSIHLVVFVYISKNSNSNCISPILVAMDSYQDKNLSQQQTTQLEKILQAKIKIY